MTRVPAKHTQADIARALRAVSQCGVKAEVILEPDGSIRIVPSDTVDQNPVDRQVTIRL